MIFLSNKEYEVGLAIHDKELDEIFSIRYQVFNKELGEGDPANDAKERDTDKFDPYCDHIIVRHIATGDIVGTYRIMLGSNAKEGYYSETEFDCTDIYSLKGEVAEVGRTCILKNHRGGKVLSLLWYGLYAYSKMFNVRYLFGMTSIHTTNPAHIDQIWAYLNEKNTLSQKVNISPINPATLTSTEGTKKYVPRLLLKYIKIGAKVIGEPNYDPIFRCYDVPTLIDLKKIHFLKGVVMMEAKMRMTYYKIKSRKVRSEMHNADIRRIG